MTEFTTHNPAQYPSNDRLAGRTDTRELSASARVYETLRGHITSGQLAPGEALPGERKLSVEFGVNRGAVREGLKRLEQSGLVTIHHGGATRVRDYRVAPTLDLLTDLIHLPNGNLDVKALRSIFELHLRVTPHAVRLAALRGGPDLESDLRTALHAIATETEPVRRFASVLEWWRTLADGCGNIAYAFMFNSLRGLGDRTTPQDAELYFATSGITPEKLQPIFEAVSKRDADLAEKHAAAFLNGAHGRTLGHMEAYQSEQTRFDRGAAPPEPTAEDHNGVADRVFAKIRDGIVSGSLQPNTVLPGERALSQAFGVNRGAVREALKRLEQAGLVATHHGGGTRVLDLREVSSMEILTDVLYRPDGHLRTEITTGIGEMRARIAPDIARLAARRGGVGLAAHLGIARQHLSNDQTSVDGRMRIWELLAWASDNLCYSFVTRIAHDGLRALRPPHRTCAITHLRLPDLDPMIDAVLAHDESRAFDLAHEVATRVESSTRHALENLPPAPDTTID